MAYYTYILESQKDGRLYIGQSNDLEGRVKRHNNNQSLSTRFRGPWQLLFHKEFSTRTEAIFLERKLKSWKNTAKIRAWIAKEHST
jgi:putative endonuclease